MNRIELDLPKDIIALAGFPYGKEIYEKQLKDKISKIEKNIIVFPNNIEIVASSFVQGLFSDLIEQMGIDKTIELIEIESLNNELSSNIKESIF